LKGVSKSNACGISRENRSSESNDLIPPSLSINEADAVTMPFATSAADAAALCAHFRHSF